MPSAPQQTAINTSHIAGSTDRLVYLNEQLLLNALDEKCLRLYNMTSSEIEKEYYKYSDQIFNLLMDIHYLKLREYEIGHFDRLIGKFNKNYLIGLEIRIQENNLIICTKVNEIIYELYNVLPYYNEWRSKINRMNIPTYTKYREIFSKFIYKDDFSNHAKKIMFGLIPKK